MTDFELLLETYKKIGIEHTANECLGDHSYYSDAYAQFRTAAKKVCTASEFGCGWSEHYFDASGKYLGTQGCE